MQKLKFGSKPISTVTVDAGIRKVIGNVEEFSRRLAWTLFDKTIMRTPVDTGALRANWWPTVRQPAETARPQDTDWRGTRAYTRMFTLTEGSWPMRDIVYLSNNLPYAITVEFGLYPRNPVGGAGKTINGYSRQAPRGMARISVQEMRRELKAIAREVKEGKRR